MKLAVAAVALTVVAVVIVTSLLLGAIVHTIW